jgi:hypothetical protein
LLILPTISGSSGPFFGSTLFFFFSLITHCPYPAINTYSPSFSISIFILIITITKPCNYILYTILAINYEINLNIAWFICIYILELNVFLEPPPPFRTKTNSERCNEINSEFKQHKFTFATLSFIDLFS